MFLTYLIAFYYGLSVGAPWNISFKRVSKYKTCQMCHDLDCSWGWSKWTEKLGGGWTPCPLITSPSLDIYSPYHHTYSMCISTVHYCCHRNVMHSVSYRLTQLIGIPCLICSGSYPHLILKGHCKYSMEARWKQRGKEGMKEHERKRRLDPPLCSVALSSHPSFLSLPLFSNVCSVHWQSVWIDGYHIHTYSYIILRTHCYIFSHSVTLCVLVSLIGSGGGQWCFQRHWHCWYSLCGEKRKVLFEMIQYRQWSCLGSGVFINHRMTCIAFIPTDHISSHSDFVNFLTLISISLFSWHTLHSQVLFFSSLCFDEWKQKWCIKQIHQC